MSFIQNNKQIVEWKSTNPPWQHTHAHHEFMLSSFPFFKKEEQWY